MHSCHEKIIFAIFHQQNVCCTSVEDPDPRLTVAINVAKCYFLPCSCILCVLILGFIRFWSATLLLRSVSQQPTTETRLNWPAPLLPCSVGCCSRNSSDVLASVPHQNREDDYVTLSDIVWTLRWISFLNDTTMILMVWSHTNKGDVVTHAEWLDNHGGGWWPALKHISHTSPSLHLIMFL